MRVSKHPLGPVAKPLMTLLVGIILSFNTWYAAGQAETLDIEQIAQRDLYAVLELEPGVSPLDVKAAYRKLARKWHPDKNPDDIQTAQGKFAEIAEAYEILSDETSRKLYDRARGLRAARQHHAAHWYDGERHFNAEGGLEDEWTTSTYWYQPYAEGGMGEADDLFGYGSSFAETAGGAGGFDTAFGSDPLGTEGGGWAFEFRPRDPIELFDAFFNGGGLDDLDDRLHQRQQDRFYQDRQHYERRMYEQMQHRLHEEQRAQEMFEQQQQYEQRRRWQQGNHEEPPWMGWIGQDFEQYHDYLHGGRMYRRVITTSIHIDGTTSSTAQDFFLDEDSDMWVATTDTFEYHGPGVGPSAWHFGEGSGNHDPVDNVLRMNEFLRAGHSISSVDRKFKATLEHNCNFAVNYTRGGASRHSEQVQVWETGSFDADGRCYAMIQSNGMLVIMSGDDPSAPGNVLWSNNRAHVGWFRQASFHASLQPNGNLVVAEGDSPMHPAAKRCLWGAFGCPGQGGVQEWRLAWIYFKSQADEIWCRIVGCDWCEATIHEACYEDELYTRNNGRGSKRWQRKSRERATGVLNASVERLRHLADGGLDKLKDAWEKIKAAAEETADAASRPRHW